LGAASSHKMSVSPLLPDGPCAFAPFVQAWSNILMIGMIILTAPWGPGPHGAPCGPMGAHSAPLGPPCVPTQALWRHHPNSWDDRRMSYCTPGLSLCRMMRLYSRLRLSQDHGFPLMAFRGAYRLNSASGC